MAQSEAIKDREFSKFVDSPTRANKSATEVVIGGSNVGTEINPLAKYVEATYTNSNQTVTYRYYESSSKVTLYNTITTNFSIAQDTSFTSAEWS